MDREKAIDRIKAIKAVYALTPTANEALDLAIEALEREIEYGQMVVDYTKGEALRSGNWEYTNTPIEQEHGRLIDADKLLQELFNVDEEEWTTPEIRAILENAPTIITSTERTGDWIGTGDGYADGELVYDTWECSECGYTIEEDDTDLLPKYCQECGAMMGGEK